MVFQGSILQIVKLFFALFLLSFGFFIPKTQAAEISTQVFSDNFDSLNSASIVGQNNWTSTGAGTASWTVGDGGPSGSGKMLTQGSATANILNGVITNTASGALGDSEVVVDFKLGSGSNPQVWLRRAGSGATTAGYLLVGPASNLRIYKEDSGGALTLLSSGTITTTLNAGTWYTAAFKAVNSGNTVNLSGYFYAQGASRPETATITASDTANTSPSGYPGLGAHGGDVVYDNFIASAISIQSAPDAPTNLSAASNSGRVALSWTAPANNGSAITDYLIEYRTGSDAFTPFSHNASTVTTTTVNGLANNTLYDFRISAINGIGTSSPSSVVSSTPAVADIPLNNIQLWLNSTTGTFQTANGSASTNNTVVGQWQDLSGHANNLQIANTSNKPKLFTGVINSLPVVRFDGTDDYLSNSTKTNWKFLHDTTGFSAFFVMKTTDANPQALMTLYDTGGSSGANIGSALAIDDSTYENGFYSPIANSGSPSPITRGVGNNLISMQTSSLVESLYLYNATGNDYNLYVNGTNVASRESGAAPTSSESTYNFTLGAMNEGASYFLKGDIAEAIFFNTQVSTSVRQHIECYFGNKYSLAVTPDCSVFLPSPITDLSGSASDTQASLFWTAPASNGAAITDYAIQYKLSASSTWTTFSDGASVATSTTVTGLVESSSYDFRVAPVNSDGTGLPSNIISQVPYYSTLIEPTVSGLSISGTLNVGGLLTGTYTFADRNGDAESASAFRWLGSDAQNGAYTTISGATDSIFLITSSELNKFIKFEITPVSARVPTTGTAATTSTSAAIGAALPIVHHILSTGQSLSVGSHGDPALTTSQPYSNLMLSGESLVPLVEGGSGVETMSSAMANTITALDSANSYQSIVSTHGVGATAYSGLKKGTSAYQNGMTQISTAQTAATVLGDSYQVAAITVIHGETDHANGTTASQYEADLVEWQSDYETDVKVVTGQTGTIPMFTDQMDSFTTYNSATSSIPIAQLSAAENNPTKIYLVGPKYFLSYYADGSHLTNSSYRWLGEYYGKVMKKVLLNAVAWKPLSPKRIVRSGNVIYASFNVPSSPIAFDTAIVTSTANYGFEYYDATTSASVSSVSIFNSDTIKVTLSATSTGNDQRLRYAYTGTAGTITGPTTTGAAHGNLRDSDGTASLYGNTLYNWAVSFDKALTVDETAPVVTNTTSTGSSTTSTITWTTGEGSSSKVDLGLIANAYTASSVETDTAYDATSHSVSFTGLSPCTVYHFRVASKDFVQNQGLSSDDTFTTTGCTGGAAVTAQAQNAVVASAGGTSSLTSGDANIALSMPAGFSTSSNVTFQIKQLNEESVMASISTPPGFSTVGNHVYQLEALTSATTTESSFLQPINITITYSSSEISASNESSLVIYRWDGNAWQQLTGCNVNTTAKTVTCQTTQFSTFALFSYTTPTTNTTIPGVAYTVSDPVRAVSVPEPITAPVVSPPISQPQIAAPLPSQPKNEPAKIVLPQKAPLKNTAPRINLTKNKNAVPQPKPSQKKPPQQNTTPKPTLKSEPPTKLTYHPKTNTPVEAKSANRLQTFLRKLGDRFAKWGRLLVNLFKRHP